MNNNSRDKWEDIELPPLPEPLRETARRTVAWQRRNHNDSLDMLRALGLIGNDNRQRISEKGRAI